MPQRRNTHQRQLVLDAVLSRCDHPTADDIYMAVRAQDNKISRATVYRNLHILVDSGDILSVQTQGGERFDSRCDGHAHIVCRECGMVVDVDDPCHRSHEAEAAASSNYQVFSHTTFFEGLCPKCQAKAEAAAQAACTAGLEGELVLGKLDGLHQHHAHEGHTHIHHAHQHHAHVHQS